MKKLANLTAVILLAIVLFAAGACSKDFNRQDLIDEGLLEVVFDENGGAFGALDSAAQWVKPGSVLAEPGSIDYLVAPTRTGYTLEGWFRGTKTGDTVTFGEQWNFAGDRVTESLTLYAKWNRDIVFQIVCVDGASGETAEGLSVASEPGEAFKPIKDPTWTGHTFMGNYFLDEGLSQPVLFDETGKATNLFHAEGEGNEIHKVYAEFMTGSYVLVRRPEDLKTIDVGKKYYLMNDIDMKDVEVTREDIQFTGQLIGNGHTIRNLRLEQKQSGQKQRQFGLFGALRGYARIENVVFENCAYVVSVGLEQQEGYSVGFLAGFMEPDTVVSGVTLVGCSASVLKSANITDATQFYTGSVCPPQSLKGKIENITGEAKVEILSAVQAG